jgi:hypothetical protein
MKKWVLMALFVITSALLFAATPTEGNGGVNYEGHTEIYGIHCPDGSYYETTIVVCEHAWVAYCWPSFPVNDCR